ncbi:M61 family metallopeptidase [Aureivirga marina]|uniref:M61 family metallopeptidase n=1 Tax=Aureivirga marina TaxID=1182451 RepID=UPI0018CA7D72|nr:peptidase M61 [Aureivirga marina]
MKKIVLSMFAVATLYSCKTLKTDKKVNSPIATTIDLVDVQDDKVKVTVDPQKIKSETIVYHVPKIVPGTYQNYDYGQYLENFKAYDYNGEELEVKKLNVNSWEIQNAKKLDKIVYLTNDTYDTEKSKGEDDVVFSPAGTNFEKDKNFVLNLHTMIGYFEGMKQSPYDLTVLKPENMYGSTSLQQIKLSENTERKGRDVFHASRYFDIIDNPIMYDTTPEITFNVNGIDISINVYSPNGTYNEESLREQMNKMMNAQKTFLGEMNTTKKYSILVYLSTLADNDAQGFGALEHHTSTVVVMPEQMPQASLMQSLTDIVSHEFFHIVTPLNVHSEEVHYFDFNKPKMSQHLWMYEGITEYFANLFQINQKLISEQDFYNRIAGKIKSAQGFNDTMSFTEMSENVLEEPYKAQYANVYQKGALIGMALDIQLRELSNGEMGILDVMKKLSLKYGMEKPFIDNEIIAEITEMTYPEIGEFFTKHVKGNLPIDYNTLFEKVGLSTQVSQSPVSYLLNGQVPFIDVVKGSKEIYFPGYLGTNSGLQALGVKSGDILKELNGEAYNLDNVQQLIFASMAIKEGDAIQMKVMRDGTEVTLTGKAIQPTVEKSELKALDLPESDAKVKLRKAWMFN